MKPTSDEIDRIDHDRRRALALLGLWGSVAYVAPVLLNLSAAHADGDGGDGDGGGTGASGDGHGSGASGDDGGHGDSGINKPGAPPEAP